MTRLDSSPSLRLFELLEIMCARGRPFTLADAIEASGWPKPSVHRMLGQLETGSLLAREPGGRRYTPAPRLLRLAESTLSAGTQHGVRHAVLRQLVADIGESCNLTALSGAEVIYLDRVQSAFPLRMELRPGTRVPIHCSASGKLFLAHLSPARRAAILDGLPLSRHTATTLTDRAALEAELERSCGRATPPMLRSLWMAWSAWPCRCWAPGAARYAAQWHCRRQRHACPWPRRCSRCPAWARPPRHWAAPGHDTLLNDEHEPELSGF